MRKVNKFKYGITKALQNTPYSKEFRVYDLYSTLCSYKSKTTNIVCSRLYNFNSLII